MHEWAEAQARASRQRRLFVDWDRMWRGEESFKPDEHRLYLGSIKAAWDDCCWRQICDESLAPYPPTALVAPYLRIISRGIDEPPHVDHPHLLARRPPLYYKEPWGGPLAYIDLSRAYWQIYTRTTLDVFYDGTRMPRRGEIKFLDAEALGRDRFARNALIGMMRREWRHGVDHGESFREPVPSHKRRPDLWGLVMDCLEVIAWAMRDLGALYVHTDGYIFGHPDLARDAIQLLHDRFGLEATIRTEGQGWVRGLGRFKVLDDEGERAERTPPMGNPVDSMLRMDTKVAEILTAWLYYTSVLPIESL